jgi:hypothetical protein
VGQGDGQGGGSLDGKVVNPNTGQPVAGVDIVLYTRQALRYETTSDAGGGFQFADVKPGNYEIRFEKEGYTFGRRDPPQPYRIAAGQPAIHVRLEMSRRAALSGRVVDGEGKPVLAQVKVAEGGLTTAVNEDGEFTIKDVEPGFYTLLAMPQAAISKDVAQKSANDAERIEPIATYYPSASDSAGAQKIVVRGDTDITGLEIRMQTAEVHRVRGVVLNEDGSPTPGARVSLAPIAMLPSRVSNTLSNTLNGTYLTILPPGRGVGPEQAQTTTDSTGAFEFPSVPSGDWQISARKSPVGSADFPAIGAGAAAALVGHADIQGLQVQQGSSFSLTGTIDWGDLPKRAGAVLLTSADGQSGGRGSYTPNAGLQLRAVPGRYYIVPQFSAGSYPDSVTLGGRDVMGQAVDLFPGSPPIQASYKPALGSVRGKVDDAASTIILIPEQVTTMGFGRMAQAKADGTFEIAGVAPGSYVIAALSGMDQRARLDSEVLVKVASSGTRVRVEQSPVEGIELTAAPWLQ